jgi:FkbM family methyltransferase
MIKRYTAALKAERHPVRFVIARLLGKTRLSRLFYIRSDGFRMVFFPTAMSSALWVDPKYRNEDTEFLRAYLRPADTVIDAGANVGFLSLLAATLVGSTGRVYAVEAHPVTASYLKQNAALNDFTNIHILATALGEQSGEILFTNSQLDDQNYVTAQATAGITVPVATLDRLFADVIGKINLLKVDVEGYELPVFRGATEILKRVDCIYLESWDQHCERYGREVGDVIAVLHAAGFIVFRPDRSQLSEVGVLHTSPECENLIAVRKDSGALARLLERGFRLPAAKYENPPTS